MLYRPSTLSGDERREFETYAEDCREEMLDHVATIVQELPPDVVEIVYELAFSTSDALPKRERRPKLDTVLVIDSVAEALSMPAPDRDALCKLTIVTQEYFDIVDDLLDGDVASDRETEALLVSQLLVPTLMGLLSRFKADASTYWATQAQEVMCVPMVESTATPDAETYRSLLDRQASLYGMLTGLAAVVNDESDDTIERYERLGETIYRHRQVVLDYEQYQDGEDDPWNARQLMDESAVLSLLATHEQTVDDLTADLPGPPRGRLRALVALDTSAWQASVSRPAEKSS
ncbi:hypothetical protein [Halorhabdus salina]|uniref:hypothetical protein n=1 Tax=Halorhabdus salina TaxID=2750670 RepID=UPI0015EE415D|nr:hypothetical protein [Halorhabdus salina]